MKRHRAPFPAGGLVMCLWEPKRALTGEERLL
jgi:hypothetical protein